MEISRTRKINTTKMSVQDSQDLMSHVNDLRNDCSMSIVSTPKALYLLLLNPSYSVTTHRKAQSNSSISKRNPRNNTPIAN